MFNNLVKYVHITSCNTFCDIFGACHARGMGCVTNVEVPRAECPAWPDVSFIFILLKSKRKPRVYYHIIVTLFSICSLFFPYLSYVITPLNRYQASGPKDISLEDFYCNYTIQSSASINK